MIRRGRRALLVGLVLIAAVSCRPTTQQRGGVPGTAQVTTDVTLSFTRGPDNFGQVRERLCDLTPTVPDKPLAPTDPPPAVAELIDQVERVRGLSFEEPVMAESVSREEMSRRVAVDVAESLEGTLIGRREAAWETLGVIPTGTDLAKEYEELYAGQVIGYYEPESGALVYIGSGDLSAMAKLTLAHELTHALDDQHFDLGRLDTIYNACREEAFEAGLAAVEGSAQLSSIDLMTEHFTLEESLGLLSEGLSGGGQEAIAGAPPFLVAEALFPYDEGLSFMQARDLENGVEAVNGALEKLPTTTEQVIHPEAYGKDEPVRVEIHDLGSEVAPGWMDLDIADVGEAFLSRMLQLRLADTQAFAAAEGWDGGAYRAWRKGDEVVVALTTAWDTTADAEEFARALEAYAAAGERAAAIRAVGARVNALFATDPASLDAFVGAVKG